jgi:hypothetical protein
MTLFRCPVFSAKAQGTFDLLTTDSTPFLPFFIVVILRRVAGFVSVPTISIGTNGPAFDNVIAATPMTGLDVAREYFRVPIGTPVGTNGVFRGIAPGESVDLKAKVTVGAQADVYDVEVVVVGGPV